MAVAEHSKGLSDQAMFAATGKQPAEWFALLDEQNATTWTHTEIARWLYETCDGLDGWWAQSVTIRYEQARGMRLPGQQADGTFSVSTTKKLPLDQGATLDAGIAAMTAHLGSPPVSENRGAKFWRARWTVEDGSSILVTADPTVAGKTALGITQSKITDPAGLDAAKESHKAVLAKLVSSLD